MHGVNLLIEGISAHPAVNAHWTALVITGLAPTMGQMQPSESCSEGTGCGRWRTDLKVGACSEDAKLL